jgi:hypothetical protein
MNVIPATILDNFLDNPNTIRDWGLSLEYKPSPNHKWPGKRSSFLHLINPELHNFLGKKVLNLFFDTPPLNWKATMEFQLISSLEGTGWVHQDYAQFTALLYLTPESKINCGSSLYKLKDDKYYPFISPKEQEINNLRIDHYKTQQLSPQVSELKDQYEKDTYEKIMDVKDKFNRLFMFSSSEFHAANYYSPQNGEDRLTLVMFFEDILHPKGFPVFRSKQTTMI